MLQVMCLRVHILPICPRLLQVNEKQTAMVALQERVHSLESKLKNLEHLQELQSSIHSQKWDEFSRLAESMKTLSRSMAQNSGAGGPSAVSTTWSTNLLDYSWNVRSLHLSELRRRRPPVVEVMTGAFPQVQRFCRFSFTNFVVVSPILQQSNIWCRQFFSVRCYHMTYSKSVVFTC